MLRKNKSLAKVLAIIVFSMGVLSIGVVNGAELIANGAGFSASKSDITSNGLRVRIAEVPGIMQSRFHYDQDGNFLYSIVVDLKNKQIVGFNDDGPTVGREVGPSNMGPPSNFTGIWELGSFPGGGRLYGEYVNGSRVATIVVQPDGSITYYPK